MSKPARRILVVEDDKDSGDSLRDLLVEMGFDVHLVRDGEAAVLAVPEVRPNIVLMDVGLPGIDGYEATRQIRQIDAGMDNFLTKPVSPKELVEGLKRYA